MESSEMEEIFDNCGWSNIYEKHQYKFWVTGLAENLQEDVLRAYLDAYSYEDTENQCFDEMLYQLRVFRYIYEKNDIRLFPRN
ncbi:hypothetical protein [Mesobacillus maritimus]|uniref:hypothetical protein n=1 Tax=Mesobacillus maritimus TaxID=1643336 RepID=UPI00384C7C28